MKYIIGIDAGATKTELVAYNLDCVPIYNKIGGYGNPSVNMNTTISNITNLIAQCLNDLYGHECVFMAIGMAGTETGEFKKIIKNYIDSTFAIDNILLNDVVMAAKAYLGNRDGILQIAGTGSSAYVQKGNIGEIVGGWGHILGDRGSGYHTVMEALKRITYQIDNNIPFDNLSKKLMERMHAKDSSDIKRYIYGSEKATIASLFPIIVELSEKGGIPSIKLLENAGKLLGQETITAYRRFEFDDKVTIGIKGGVLHNSEIVYSSYEKYIRDFIEDCEIIKEDLSVTKAVCNIYGDMKLA